VLCVAQKCKKLIYMQCKQKVAAHWSVRGVAQREPGEHCMQEAVGVSACGLGKKYPLL